MGTLNQFKYMGLSISILKISEDNYVYKIFDSSGSCVDSDNLRTYKKALNKAKRMAENV